MKYARYVSMEVKSESDVMTSEVATKSWLNAARTVDPPFCHNGYESQQKNGHHALLAVSNRLHLIFISDSCPLP